MPQLLLFADRRPLVERLGLRFFQQAPQSPGVYLMRDARDVVVYVGKAKNLKRRLASYRVANPERLARRHLKLLSVVERIELRQCSDEAEALATESGLLKTLRPRFNRAGTWPSPTRFLAWRNQTAGLELAVLEIHQPGWSAHQTSGANAILLRACLVRLLWCAVHPHRGLCGMPAGWFDNYDLITQVIPKNPGNQNALNDPAILLNALFAGEVDKFTSWLGTCTSELCHPFEVAAREEALQTLLEYVQKYCHRNEGVI